MTKPTDARPVAAAVYFLPIRTRMPLKFGPEITTEVTCARIRVTVADRAAGRGGLGRDAPLGAMGLAEPAGYEERHQAFRRLTCMDRRVMDHPAHGSRPSHGAGRPVPRGDASRPARRVQRRRAAGCRTVPWLAALVCASAFDLAVHDAYGVLHGLPTYETYNARFMNVDLDDYLEAAPGSDVSFAGRYPEEFLVRPRPQSLPAWHLVGGKDPVDAPELTGAEPDDGYPVLLRDWIRRDGLKCLKVKLRGDDAEWDFARLIQVGKLAIDEGVDWLTADFNCTVGEPSYVIGSSTS